MSLRPVSRVIKLQDRETVKFIELYASERVLYDPNCKDYKDRGVRLAAAKRISESMGISGFGPREVVAKFKNLRSSYCQELKKIAESEESGCTPDNAYVPSVVWFDTMNAFIRPFVQQRSKQPNLMMMPTNPASPVSVDESSINFNSELMPDTASTSNSIATYSDVVNTAAQIVHTKDLSTPYYKRKTSPEPSPSQRKKIARDPQPNFYMCDSLDKFEEISNRAAQIQKEDCYDYFGKYVSSMLRTIGPPTAMRLQEQITRLMTQAMCPPSSWSLPTSSNQLSNDASLP